MASLDLTYAYAKPRSQFGRQYRLTDRQAELISSIESDIEQTDKFIARNPVHRSTQCSDDMSLHEVSSVYYRLKLVSLTNNFLERRRAIYDMTVCRAMR